MVFSLIKEMIQPLQWAC